MAGKLRVLLVDPRRERSGPLADALEAEGHEVVGPLAAPADLHASVLAVDPDVIIIDLESPDRDALEDMRRIGEERPRPIVMFVDESDADSIRTAVRAGVAAYVVRGASPERVKPLLEVAIARFEEFQTLRSELERVKSSLADRKVIEKAKGILMRRGDLSEEEAYRALRRLAMNRNARLGDVARSVIEMAEIL